MEADPKKLRAWARLLSTLLQTPDDELDDFARERLAAPDLDQQALAKGRDLLIHVGRALDHPDPERWKGIAHAVSTIEHWEQGRAQRTKPSSDVAAAAPAPAPAAPATPAPRLSPLPIPAAPPVLPVSPRMAAPVAAAPSPWMKGAAPLPPSSPPPPGARDLAAVSPRLQETAPARGPTGDPLPFRAGAAPPPPAPIGLEPNPALGFTVTAASKKGPTLPFAAVTDKPAASEPPAGMTLGRYAEMCVERTLWPANTQGRRARFGLDEAGEAQADEYFRRRFDRDPSQRTTWLALCAVHKKKLEEG